ncbi:MAG: energy transducer TonB [Pseudomonadota bacterium]|nr:energy transducer TonB [Pseudomonadota bacterium]
MELASEDVTLEALKFSLASDVVELVVLTTDQVFLRTLRAALGDARRLWHVPSADKVSDLLVAGQVGILVLDTQALLEAANLFVEHIKRQFPDLVVVAAGHRDDETSLARIISSGLVYRFIHKPMSPARARLFAEAAIRKYQEQRRRDAELPRRKRAADPSRIWLISAAVAATVIAVIAVVVHRSADLPAALTPAAPVESAETARADQAEVHEQQLVRAQNAFLEQLKSAQLKAAQSAPAQSPQSTQPVQSQPPRDALVRVLPSPKAEEERVMPLLDLAARRLAEGHLLDLDRDNARFYVQQALDLDPQNAAAQRAKRALSSRLLEDARAAIDHREFARASSLLEGADGVADRADIEPLRYLLAGAQKQVDTDAWSTLLKNANERLLQDRLTEPANDNAKYFYLRLKQLDPSNAALSSLLQDLGTRLTAKARRALILGQSDAAKTWLDEAGAVGFSSAEVSSAHHDLDVLVARQNLVANLVPSSQLKLLKSVQPVYPYKAQGKAEGWVDVEFTVSESGKVQDVAVHAASAPGTFDDAAVKAVSKWRYQPVMLDAKPVAVRTQIRIRFSLS